MPKLQTPEIDPVTDPGVAVLNEHQAAKYLGLSVFTLRRLHDPESKIQAPKKLQLSTNRIGYRKATLDAWLAERETA